ncbi:uncharacterized protein METZ01_LOCUS314816 [marine metagenome]|uniref:Uncharacterized protein n=1 Tax=marine metagenome TaxID=408172 RepID=A0A382NQD8_9ZZZZ
MSVGRSLSAQLWSLGPGWLLVEGLARLLL